LSSTAGGLEQFTPSGGRFRASIDHDAIWRRLMKFPALLLGMVLAFAAGPAAAAENAREILMTAAFASTDKATALAGIDRALKAADAVLVRSPGDQEARLQHALAISYRGKLTRSRTDIMAARRGFEAVLAADPRSADANMAIAGWHLGSIIELGPLLAATMLGAKRSVGLKALDRAVALGGNRAFFPALACLHRIQLDPGDVRSALNLAETAVKADANTPADRVMQKFAAALLVPLRKGNGGAAAKAAKLLLPFARVR
jgi:hypothetical protein